MEVTSTGAYLWPLCVIYTAGTLAPDITTANEVSKASDNTANYTLTFYTCDVLWAGTEGTVNVTLTGLSGKSVILQFDGKDKLDKQTTGIFSRGVTYSVYREITDVGPVCQIFVERIEMVKRDGWKLRNVSVSYMDDLARFIVSDCPVKADLGWFLRSQSLNRTDGSCDMLPNNKSASDQRRKLSLTAVLLTIVATTSWVCGLVVGVSVGCGVLLCRNRKRETRNRSGRLSEGFQRGGTYDELAFTEDPDRPYLCINTNSEV